MATINAASLADAIDKILTEYAEGIQDDLTEVTNKVAQEGAKALRAASRSNFGGTGKYAKGGTVEKAKGGSRQIVAEATIYNRHPGLPHLLENGHAKRGGGRVPGKTHIAPVEQELIKQFEEQIEKAVSK